MKFEYRCNHRVKGELKTVKGTVVGRDEGTALLNAQKKAVKQLKLPITYDGDNLYVMLNQIGG